MLVHMISCHTVHSSIPTFPLDSGYPPNPMCRLLYWLCHFSHRPKSVATLP